MRIHATVLVCAIRWILATVLAVSGAGKLLDADMAVQFTRIVVEQVVEEIGKQVPEHIVRQCTMIVLLANRHAATIVIVISTTELLLAFGLFWRKWAVRATTATLALLVCFTGTLAWLVVQHPQSADLISCGCSGALEQVIPASVSLEMSLFRNLVLIALAVMALLLADLTPCSTHNSKQHSHVQTPENNNGSLLSVRTERAVAERNVGSRSSGEKYHFRTEKPYTRSFP